MKIISDGNALGKTIIKLIDKHSYFSFAVAWASSGTNVFDHMRQNKKKIKN